MPPQKDEDVLALVREALMKSKSKWTLLSKQTGRELSYRWITGVANGEIKEPSFQKVCKLARYLGIKIQLVPGKHFLKFKPE